MTIYNYIVWLTIVTSINNDFRESSPSYIKEKSAILNEPEREGYGFGYLDQKNMARAVDYCERWNVPVPSVWYDELKRQTLAAAKLGLL
jgi:hypothetical protein